MVLVTGASGFIGGHLVARLVAEQRSVRGMVRPGRPKQFLERRGVAAVEADVTQPHTLAAAVEGVESIVHLVGLIVDPPGQTFESVVAEGTRSLVQAAERAGVKRFVFVSAVGAQRDAASRYHRSKALAEGAVRRGAFEHVIVRPSLVYGPGDGFVSRFVEQPLPIPGDGRGLFQPVHVDDLVTVLTAALDRPDLANRTLDVGGPEAMTLNDIVDTVERVTGRAGALRHVHLPLGLVQLNARLFDALRKPLQAAGAEPPVTTDQLLMLSGDHSVDILPLLATLDFEPRRFEDGLHDWLTPKRAA